MSVLNQLYMVIDKQLFDGQRCLNVYGYRVSTAGADVAEGLVVPFELGIINPVANLQHNTLTHTAISVINLNDPADFFEGNWSPVIAGANAGDVLAPFYAYTFIENRSSRLSRNGFKRFAGVPEGASTDGQTVGATYVASVIAVATALHTILVGLGATSYTPCILHRPRPGHPTWTATDIAGAGFAHFGTQNTRKIGRGH